MSHHVSLLKRYRKPADREEFIRRLRGPARLALGFQPAVPRRLGDGPEILNTKKEVEDATTQ